MMPQRESQLALLDSAKGFLARETIAAAVAAAAEAVAVLLAFSTAIPMVVSLAVHGATVCIIAVILFRQRPPDDDPTIAELMFLVIAVAGPAGALASLAALGLVDHAGAGPVVLDAWYKQLAKASTADASTELTDRVVAGRVLRTDAPAPENFEDVIASGTLAERQAALGLIARHFHTDYAPALQAALRSAEPVVRVQAAAVVARVRVALKLRVKELLAVGDDRSPQRDMAAAAELTSLAGCGFVDRADAEKCLAAAGEILRTSLQTSQDVLMAAAGATPDTAILAERYLMTSGRHNAFRLSRRVHALVLGGKYRVRFHSRRMAA